jgi:hypothetical protein
MKSEIRNPKSERRPNSEARIEAPHPNSPTHPSLVRNSSFGLLSDFGFRISELFCLLLSAFFPLSNALASPPGPYHLLYGTVRDGYGTPLTSANAQVIFQTPAGPQLAAPIIPGISPGVNFQMKVPLDSGSTPDLYQPNALVPGTAFKFVVVVGGVTNLPIEMAVTNLSLGLWAKTTRVDLTLGVDSNGDGIPDAWENAFLAALGLNIPLSSINANSVLTADGLTLRQEYLLGTYPFDPGDPLMITFVGFYGAAPILQFPTVSGRSYTVLSSTDLKNWNPAGFNLAGDAPGAAPRSFYLASSIARVQVYVAPPAPGAPKQFYRIQVQ